MQYSKSTGYALHALVHLAQTEPGQYVGIKDLSTALGVSDSYLSKIMSKLRQDGIVRAVTGASGGYELARAAGQITFLDVIQVVEGRQHLYECFHMNANRHLATDPDAVYDLDSQECLVKKVMIGAEMQMHQYLEQHTIQGVLDAHPLGRNHAGNKKA
ncbi:Rrf2 family transcriptional regulator [Brevibacillus choshinensis]|uniref:RrF2 family transcriptional regulator n=1 Tax=Brevibacillus choshinensis TaxID=54911 RepID=UPI002E2373EF|nr:Rrf2 family transcriptional regulator [Brevibacillus choshinensis]MED4753578.1 Rrf2 family transcriptional regulator [Brevibacillus choshinensis]MED4781990.1 Rrf2 family transcriptional regulator [Brevibacillus choshinensis]